LLLVIIPNSKVLLVDFSTFQVLQEVCIPPKDYHGDDSPSEIIQATPVCVGVSF